MTTTSFQRAGAALCLAAGLILSGCSLAPDYRRPEMDIPENWNSTPCGNPTAEKGLEVRWWKRFHDPVLDRLVEETQMEWAFVSFIIFLYTISVGGKIVATS